MIACPTEEELRQYPAGPCGNPLPSPEELRGYFGAFGEIESVNVKTDPTTGRSRGFAFLVFSQPETVEKVSAVHWVGLGPLPEGLTGLWWSCRTGW